MIDLERVGIYVVTLVIVAMWCGIVWISTNRAYDAGFTAGTKNAIVLPPIEVTPDTILLGELVDLFSVECYYVRDE